MPKRTLDSCLDYSLFALISRIFYGTPVRKETGLVLEQPKIYEEKEYEELLGRLIPVYPATKGLKSRQIEKLIGQALKEGAAIPDTLPDAIRSRRELLSLSDALFLLHRPKDAEELGRARRRIVYEEFFFFLLSIQALKKKGTIEKNHYPIPSDGFAEELIRKLPFTLTDAQERSFWEAMEDLGGPGLMNRLLQGDVGSGKTILAFLLMAVCSHAGYQSALMAPTEVLAAQHAKTFRELADQLGLKTPVILLTGHLKAAEKKKAREQIREEAGAFVIGTHALFQEGVEFHNPALVITDEQHRFGVLQREALREKGISPHVLVMSATPIPRTLAIILFQDLDISVIDHLPSMRLPRKNYVVDQSYRSRIWAFLEKEVRAGHQAYVICPLVSESEGLSAENVTDYAIRLQEAMPPDISVEPLHGKMKSEEKNRIMERFAAGEIHVLVSTTVVEVGVNVPNATVICVENAERFGLAQLHQLRGRVGRGSAQSYCIFIHSGETKNAKERLEILVKSNDGFQIADEDLKQRGPGDFLGIRQSGEFAFGMADIYQDAKELKDAAEDARAVSDGEMKLSKEEQAALHDLLLRQNEHSAVRINL